MDTLIRLVVIVPVFSVLLYKLSYPLWMLSAFIDDWFDLFTFFWIDCAFIGTLSWLFKWVLLALLVFFIYNKLKS